MHPIDSDIKSGNFHNIYLLYGDEDFLRLTYKNKLKNALVNPGDSMNYTKFDKFNIETKALVELANTMPLFAEHRTIIVDDCGMFSKSNEELAEYLKNPNESTVVIFTETSVDKRTNVYKALKDRAQLVECVLPKDKTQAEQELAAWIGGRLKKMNKQIKRDAWAEFYNRCSSSMSLMDTEFEKLISYIGDKDCVELADVKAICTGAVEEKVFEMIEAISAKNLEGTMSHYRALLEAREEPVKIIRLLQTQFNKILIAKNMASQRYSDRDIANASGINPYFVKKTLNLSRSFTEKEVLDFLEKSTKYEQQMKSGLINSQYALELLILEYMK